MAYIISQCSDNLYCKFVVILGTGDVNGMESLSAVARARYESKVLQAGLGIDSLTIQLLLFTALCPDGTEKNLT